MKYETKEKIKKNVLENRDNNTVSKISLFGAIKYGEEMTLVKITRENLKNISQDNNIWRLEFKTGGMRLSEYLFHKIMKRLAIIVKTNFLRTLEINKRLPKLWIAIIQKQHHQNCWIVARTEDYVVL